MLNYRPLKETLKQKGLVLSDLRDTIGLNSRTQAIISRNEPVSLATIHKICTHLNVPIEKVIELELGDMNTEE
ncbi:helix-turn-helix domain-containing protein [Cytobacillus solani]|uniref:HTH cro/C1-type domain-containing protein n=1 Tax=Cytobacillus solani TaxID=1637975 RepID=A0A0Q3QLE3_9BACI|nr:helix-turn-helix transcriptional regulator [Cytobacillus solani]KQL18817.1 hypothetical protein AN957_09695 [Cytobacillus solani]